MQHLPAIINDQHGRKAVSAIALHEGLGYNITHYARWAKKNIVENPFAVENEDFIKLALMASLSKTGRGNTTDYILSLPFAKRLAMMARTEAGERIRQYFIQVEGVALEAARQQQPQTVPFEYYTNLLSAYNTLLSAKVAQGSKSRIKPMAPQHVREAEAAAEACFAPGEDKITAREAYEIGSRWAGKPLNKFAFGLSMGRLVGRSKTARIGYGVYKVYFVTKKNVEAI